MLDASAALAWCFSEELDERAKAFREEVREDPLDVPLTWPMEIANVLVAAERQRWLLSDDIRAFLKLIAEFDIRVNEDTLDRALNEVLLLARRERLSAYDAAYLDLAIRRDLPLATRDKSLAAAATRLGIPLIPA